MYQIKANYCDFFTIKEKAKGIICCKSNKVLNVNERVELIASSDYSGCDSLKPMEVVIKRVACIAGFDSDGEGLYVLEVSRL